MPEKFHFCDRNEERTKYKIHNTKAYPKDS